MQRYFVPLGVGARLKSFGVPANRIVEMDWWDEQQWRDVTVTAAPSQHSFSASMVYTSRWSGASAFLQMPLAYAHRLTGVDLAP